MKTKAELLEGLIIELALMVLKSSETSPGERIRINHILGDLQYIDQQFAKPHCVFNEGWGVTCGKPATHEVRINGFKDKPSLACGFHAGLSEANGFDVRILNIAICQSCGKPLDRDDGVALCPHCISKE